VIQDRRTVIQDRRTVIHHETRAMGRLILLWDGIFIDCNVLRSPSAGCSVVPSFARSAIHSICRSAAPTTSPSAAPSVVPSLAPSAIPSVFRSVAPTTSPWRVHSRGQGNIDRASYYYYGDGHAFVASDSMGHLHVKNLA
jgi:hypothetical protein